MKFADELGIHTESRQTGRQDSKTDSNTWNAPACTSGADTVRQGSQAGSWNAPADISGADTKSLKALLASDFEISSDK